MNNFIKSFDKWHKTKPGYAVMGVLELALAYVLGSRAIDTGSIWQYFFTLLLIIGSLYNFYQLIHAFICKNHGKK
jgi:hypothetical protein